MKICISFYSVKTIAFTDFMQFMYINKLQINKEIKKAFAKLSELYVIKENHMVKQILQKRF